MPIRACGWQDNGVSCCASGEKYDNYCTQQSEGALCDYNKQCSSGNCIQKHCQASKNAVNETCIEDEDCTSGFCRHASNVDNTDYVQVCCAPDKVYVNGYSDHFCTHQSLGSYCQYDEQCLEGNFCFGIHCRQSKLADREYCYN